MNECFALAKRSTKSFKKGKSYQHCRKVNELLVPAMEILHDQIFIESTKQVAEYMNFMKQETERTRDAKDIQNDIFSKEMLDLLKSYKKLCTRY